MQNAKLRNSDRELYCNLKICPASGGSAGADNLQFAFCNSRKGGFTLLELIIVLFIIGIALGFTGLTLYYRGSHVELNTFVKDVSATLRYARSRSIAEKKIYSFIMREDNRVYGLYVDFPDDYKVEEPAPLVYKTVPEPLEAVLKSKKGDFRIDFFPQGNSSGGIIEVKNQKGITYLIMVNKITGRVEVKNAENL